MTNLKNNDINSIYSLCRNENCTENKKISPNNIIYLEEPLYNENLLINLENKEDLLLCTSLEYFYDFDSILYDKNLDIEQNENILKIKFNTTSYNSKLEYYVALVDNEKEINPLSFRNIIFENNSVYRNILYSIGI